MAATDIREGATVLTCEPFLSVPESDIMMRRCSALSTKTVSDLSFSLCANAMI